MSGKFTIPSEKALYSTHRVARQLRSVEQYLQFGHRQDLFEPESSFERLGRQFRDATRWRDAGPASLLAAEAWATAWRARRRTTWPRSAAASA